MTSRGGDPGVQAFVAVARQYRAAVDTRDADDPAAFLCGVHRLLAGLCYAAEGLPRMDEVELPPGSEGLVTRADADGLVEVWRPLAEALEAELDEDAYYWEVSDPYGPGPAEPADGSLADDLANVYMDLDDGLRRWDTADDALRRTIAWEWRFSYESHWGRHAIGAMGAIHALLYVHRLGEEDEDDA
jgi:hypothetical protein